MNARPMQRRVHLVAAILLLGLSACGEEEAEGARAGGPGGGRGGWEGAPPAQAAIPVKTEKAMRQDMAAYVQTYARLEAERWVDVLARATGLVEQILVEEGKRVAEGQVLVRLEKEELLLRLQQAEVALQQVRSGFERTQALHERKMVSDSEFETARHQFEEARVRLEEARLNLDYADIRAPIDGMIMQRLVEVGDLVRANQQVFALADVEPLLARIHVPEKRMHQMRAGQEARVDVESLPGTAFEGRIRMISPGVDPQSGTVKVTLEIPATDRLKPGMFASVRIITDRHPQTLVIPKKALVLETDEDDAFVVEDGKVRRARLELGFVEGDLVEVLSGLAEGQEVVTVGQEGLKDGTAVRVVGALGEAPAASAAAPEAPAADADNPMLVALREILTAEQRQKLAELQAREGGQSGDMRTLVAQLDLNEEQRQKMREMMRQQFGGGGRGGRPGAGP